jgi:hypothetical protein
MGVGAVHGEDDGVGVCRVRETDFRDGVERGRRRRVASWRRRDELGVSPVVWGVENGPTGHREGPVGRIEGDARRGMDSDGM